MGRLSNHPSASVFAPRALDCLLGGYLLILSAQLTRLPWWLSAFALGCGMLGWWIRRRGWRPLGRSSLMAMTLLAVVVFWLVYRGHFTVETAASFFVVTVALKWLELRSRRDFFILFFILCYLVIVTLLFQDAIGWTLLLLAAIFLLFNGLQYATGGRLRGVSVDTWKRSGWLFLKALPVVAILFVFFPRMGPLWSVPLVSDQATTGLSDEMTPGDVSSLAQNSDRAFRVEFGGDAPPPAARYWRALILDEFDGRTWRRSNREAPEQATRVNTGAPADALSEDEYQILMEPSFRRWGYALKDSIPASPNLDQDGYGLVRFQRSVDTRVRYRMQFDERPHDQRLGMAGRRHYTALPAEGNARTRTWVAEARARTEDAEAFIQLVMNRFRDEPFYYTLEPPPLGDEPVDELMYDTQRGFCEHYASALAFMLRAADIPARIMTGYLGGESGLNNDYLIIRQYDAHAWVEAWLPDQGWVRLDPTAMIAPQRIELGLREAMREEGSFLRDSPTSPERYQDIAWLNQLRLRADAVNFYWQRWVVGYQGQTQMSLFSSLPGNLGLRELGFLTAGLVAILIALSGLWALWRHSRRKARDPFVKVHRRWELWLQRRKVPAGSGDSPLQQARKAAECFPQHREALLDFGQRLNRIFFAGAEAPETRELNELRQAFRAIRSIRSARGPGRAERPMKRESAS